MAFPELGYDATVEQFIIQGFNQGSMLFKMASGQHTGQGADDGLFYLSLTAGMIGAALMVFNQKNHNFSTVVAWLALLLIMIIGPLKNELVFYSFDPASKSKQEDCPVSFGSSPDCVTAFTPQLVTIHVLSTLHKAIYYSLFDCQDHSGDQTKGGEKYECKRRNELRSLGVAGGLGSITNLRARDAALSHEIALYGQSCGSVGHIYQSPYSMLEGVSEDQLSNFNQLALKQSIDNDLKSGAITYGDVFDFSTQSDISSESSSQYFTPFAVLFADPKQNASGSFLDTLSEAYSLPIEHQTILTRAGNLSDGISTIRNNATEFINISAADCQNSYSNLQNNKLEYLISPFAQNGNIDTSCPMVARATSRGIGAPSEVSANCTNARRGGQMCRRNGKKRPEFMALSSLRDMPVMLGLPRFTIEEKDIKVTSGQSGKKTSRGTTMQSYDYIENARSNDAFDGNDMRHLGVSTGENGTAIKNCQEFHKATNQRLILAALKEAKVPTSMGNLILQDAAPSLEDVQTTPEEDIAKGAGSAKQIQKFWIDQYQRANKEVDNAEFEMSAADAARFAHLMTRAAVAQAAFNNSKPLQSYVAARNDARKAAIASARHGPGEMDTSTLKYIDTPASVLGSIATFIGEVGTVFTGFFAGTSAVAYLHFLKLMVQMALMAALLLTPLIFLMGLVIPSYAPGVLIVSIGLVLVIRMIPITYTVVDFVLGTMYDTLSAMYAGEGWDRQVQMALLSHAAATIYTSLIMITMYILFKIGDPQTAIEGLNKLEGAANEIANSATTAANALAGVAATVVTGAVLGAGGATIAAGRQLAAGEAGGKVAGAFATNVAKQTTDVLTKGFGQGAGQVPLVGNILKESFGAGQQALHEGDSALAMMHSSKHKGALKAYEHIFSESERQKQAYNVDQLNRAIQDKDYGAARKILTTSNLGIDQAAKREKWKELDQLQYGSGKTHGHWQLGTGAASDNLASQLALSIKRNNPDISQADLDTQVMKAMSDMSSAQSRLMDAKQAGTVEANVASMGGGALRVHNDDEIYEQGIQTLVGDALQDAKTVGDYNQIAKDALGISMADAGTSKAYGGDGTAAVMITAGNSESGRPIVVTDFAKGANNITGQDLIDYRQAIGKGNTALGAQLEGEINAKLSAAGLNVKARDLDISFGFDTGAADAKYNNITKAQIPGASSSNSLAQAAATNNQNLVGGQQNTSQNQGVQNQSPTNKNPTPQRGSYEAGQGGGGISSQQMNDLADAVQKGAKAGVSQGLANMAQSASVKGGAVNSLSDRMHHTQKGMKKKT